MNPRQGNYSHISTHLTMFPFLYTVQINFEERGTDSRKSIQRMVRNFKISFSTIGETVPWRAASWMRGSMPRFSQPWSISIETIKWEFSVRPSLVDLNCLSCSHFRFLIGRFSISEALRHSLECLFPPIFPVRMQTSFECRKDGRSGPEWAWQLNPGCLAILYWRWTCFEMVSHG